MSEVAVGAIRQSPFSFAWRQIRLRWPLAPIVLVHVSVFMLMQHSLIASPVPIVPEEITASFISQEQAVQPQVSPPVAHPAVTQHHVKQTVAPTHVIDQAAIEPVKVRAQETPAAPPVQEVPPTAALATIPGPPAEPKTFTSGIEYIRAPRPEQPQISIKRRETGTVVLRVLVNEKGEPEKVEIRKTSGFERLDDVARQAVLAALFKPHSVDGKAVPMFAILPINFSLID